MNNIPLHWTEDPSLLEQFVLGRIPESRLQDLRKHLDTCAACRRAVQQEQNFVRSVRAYGRDQLRLRLKEKIGRYPSRVVPWPHVLSAAAIVLFVVGLGIYNRWWREPELVQSEEQMAGERKDQGPPAPSAAEEKEAAGIDDMAGDKPSTGVSGQQHAGKITGEAATKEKKREEIKLPPAFAEQPQQVIAADEHDTGKRGESEYWVDGVLLDLPLEKDSKRRALQDRDAAIEAGKAQARKEMQATQQGKYMLQQRPETALPAEQQRMRKAGAFIPTKVVPTADGAILTIYTNQLDLQSKTVQGEFAGRDSLIFVVEGVRIAYKLPSFPVKQ